MKKNKFSLKKRLLLYILILLFIGLFLISFIIYNISKTSLDNQGKTILKNATKMAIELSNTYYSQVDKGYISRKEALEELKIKLMGKKNLDGTRNISSDIDLGNYGYFIIYDLDGKEIMHPKLEGKNVINVVDPIDKDYYFVKEQIKKALDGGGFIEYNWEFPDSDKIDLKISYAEYSKDWNFVIVASTYATDFNKSANIILIVIITLFSFIFLCSYYLSDIYVEKVSVPIKKIISLMKDIDDEKYIEINNVNREDEIGQLINGFNKMINRIKDRNENIKEKTKAIEKLAYYDQLSELPNFHYFTKKVNELINNKSKFTMTIFDIKELGIINSVMGYEKGDRVIKAIGKTLLKYSIEEDLLAFRASGNEFVLLTKGEIEKHTEYFFDFEEKLKNNLIDNEIFMDLKFHKIIVSFPEHGNSFTEIYNNATIALSYAKKFHISEATYDSEMSDFINNESNIKNAILNAFKENEFIPVYQYQVDKNNEIIGVEGLLRLNSKILGKISPGVFIPFINDSDFVNSFGKYTLELFLNDYKKLKEKYNDSITLSINISPKYFISNNFVENVISTINKYNVPFNKIILEITEDIFIKDFDLVDHNIRKLKEYGIRISIDDFGTGYSSLSYIQKINADELKIDRSFIKEILDDEKKKALYHSICKIARTYDFDIIVEGVETKEQRDVVIDEEIHGIQGYYYSKPEKI